MTELAIAIVCGEWGVGSAFVIRDIYVIHSSIASRCCVCGNPRMCAYLLCFLVGLLCACHVLVCVCQQHVTKDTCSFMYFHLKCGVCFRQFWHRLLLHLCFAFPSSVRDDSNFVLIHNKSPTPHSTVKNAEYVEAVVLFTCSQVDDDDNSVCQAWVSCTFSVRVALPLFPTSQPSPPLDFELQTRCGNTRRRRDNTTGAGYFQDEKEISQKQQQLRHQHT